MQDSQLESGSGQGSAPAVRFTWRSSFLGCIHYEVFGDGPTYRIERRLGVSDYERSIYNGTEAEWQRDCVSAIGLIRRLDDNTRALSPSVVEAFNAWRAREQEKFGQELRTQPERYGVIEENDPLLTPPAPARGAHYEVGTGWVVDSP